MPGEQQMTAAFDEAALFPEDIRQRGEAVGGAKAGVACAPREVVALEAPDRAIRRRAFENTGIAEVNEVGNRAGGEKQTIKRHGRRRLEQIARRNENQLAAGLQMAQTFLDEEKVKVGTAVEHGVAGQPPRSG